MEVLGGWKMSVRGSAVVQEVGRTPNDSAAGWSRLRLVMGIGQKMPWQLQ